MSEPAKNILLRDVEIKGTLVFENDLITDGKIEGEILSSGNLTVGKNGSVKGDIQAAVAAIHGVVNGNITVQERCELRGEAQLIGDLEAPRLVIEEGATFVGRSRVLPASAPRELGSPQSVQKIEGPIQPVAKPKEESPSAVPAENAQRQEPAKH